VSSGKEGFPTVAFQVIVDHSTKILAISPCYPGSHTDISISRLDEEVNSIRFNPLFADFPFSLLVQPGVREINQGVYLIADGGYQYWRVLQQTDKLNTGLFLAAASKHFFAQTDIWLQIQYFEDFFPKWLPVAKMSSAPLVVLKTASGAFIQTATADAHTDAFCRILKTALGLENIEDIHKLFKCCCILHNMLLLVDRPFDDSQPTASEILSSHVSASHFNQDNVAGDSDHSGVGMEGAPPHLLFQDGRTEPTHYTLRNKLAAHYNIAVPSAAAR
jgi:hypothetical protein